MEVVEGDEVSLLTDQDVVPGGARGAGEVGVEAPGDEAGPEPEEAVQHRLAAVPRHGDRELQLLLPLLVHLPGADEVEVGRTVGEQRTSQPQTSSQLHNLIYKCNFSSRFKPI